MSLPRRTTSSSAAPRRRNRIQRTQITVPFEYRVIFSDGVLKADNPVLADLLSRRAASGRGRAAVIIDRQFQRANPGILTLVNRYFAAHRQRIELASSPLLISGGEAAKRGLDVFQRCLRHLHDARVDRHSYAIVIGGGAVLDAAGFAAAVVHRGVRLIRVPTTALAQNDAGVGVKNGIDYLGRKNFLGTFYPPWAVLNDFTLLGSLPPSAWKDGIAEAVKVALIRDRAFFDWIERHAEALARLDEMALRVLIRRCAELHLQHIATSGDPFEQGSARPLDFGHWSAHKIEQLSGFRIGHGSAVAAGMAIDVLYSNAIGLLDRKEAARILACLERLELPQRLGPRLGLAGKGGLGELLGGLEEFQEHLGGKLCLPMLRRIGKSVDIDRVDRALLKRCAIAVLVEGGPCRLV